MSDNFRIEGIYDGSQIARGIQDLGRLEAKIQQLNSSMGKIQSPKIAAPNMSNFFSEMDKAGSLAGKGTIEKMFAGVNFGQIGQRAGGQYATGLMAGMGPMGGIFGDLATAIGPAGIVAGAAVAGAAVIGAAAVNAAKNWESLMSGVLKTSGLQKGTQDANALSEALLNLSKTAGMGSQASLATIAQLAGGQGIGSKAADAGNYALQRQQILAYTQDVQGMATAFDMVAEDAATMGAAVQKSFKLPMDEIHHMGSMVTTVGDSVGVQEKKILEFLSRAGGSRIAVNEGVTKTAAFGSALMSTGMQAEVAASSITMMESQVLGNDEKMTKWAKTLGVTKEALWEMTKTDFYGTVLKTGDLMSKMDLSKSIPLATEIFGPEVAKYVSKMGGVGEDYARGVEKGNAAMIEGTRLAAVFGEKGATIDSKWQAFSNTMNTAFVHLGNTALPVIGDIINAMAGMVNFADKFGQAIYEIGAKTYGKAAGAYDWASKGTADTVARSNMPGMAEGVFGWLNQFGSNETNDPALQKRITEQQSGRLRAESVQGGLADWTNEADITAAGAQSGVSFIDALDSQLKAGVPKSMQDAYLGAVGLHRIAGQDAGKAWGDSFAAYIKNNVAPQIAALRSSGFTDEQALAMINSQTGSSGKKSSENSLDILGNLYSIKKTSTGSGIYETVLKDGKEVAGSTFKYFEDAGSDASQKIAVAYFRSIRGSIRDASAFVDDQYGKISKSAGEAFADGAFDPDVEKKQFETYKTLLETYKNAPETKLNFGVDDQALLDGINRALAGGKFEVPVSVVGVEADFEVWLQDNKTRFEEQWKNTKVMPTRDSQYERWQWELAHANDPQAMKYLRGLDASATSDDPGVVSGGKVFANALLKYDPALAKTTWLTQELGSAQVELNTHVKNAGGVFQAFDEDGKQLDGVFVDTSIAGQSLGTGLTNTTSVLPFFSGGIANATSGLNALAGAARSAVPSTQKNFLPYTYPIQGNQGNDLNKAGSFFSGATVGGSYTSLMTRGFFDSLKIPKLQTGGLLTSDGLVYAHKDERVIPESDIKGLYPESAKVDKASFQYQTNDQYFQDYPYRINAPTSYQWSQYPNAPTVQTTGNMPTAWLSDKQTTGNEAISSEIRAAQLRAIGNSQVKPWFADELPKIGPDKVAANRKLTNRDVWNAIYDNSGTCIAFVEPDPSLKFTPGRAYLPGGAGLGNLDQPISSGKVISTLTEIEKNTGKSIVYQREMAKAFTVLPSGQSNGFFSKDSPLVVPGGGSAPVENWSAWNAIYDNSGTCIAFVEPDPSLNFTPNKDYQKGGYRLGNMGDAPTSLGDSEIQTWDPVVSEAMQRANALSDEANKEAAKIARNTANMSTGLSQVAGALVVGMSGGGGSGVWGMNGGGGGSYGSFFGNSWKNGGPAAVGTFRNEPSWGGVAASNAASGGGVSYGSAGGYGAGNSISGFFADGGFADRATVVYGEAGREAFVPISDRAAGLRILPQVMAELGVRTMEGGGFVGSPGNLSAAMGASNYVYAPVIQGVGLSKQEIESLLEKDHKKFLAEIPKKGVMAAGRRS